MRPRGHLLGRDWPFCSVVCGVLMCFVTFPYGVLGRVWNLIVLIPDISSLLIQIQIVL